ncbi:hypothetical protein CRUP_019445 [Coryphaenoides rupestris]|nr:hypothetical protein CRUP_019445 [Coryphaenoides rupestris]
MFGKARAWPMAAVPERLLAECNLVLLGATGAGKSEDIYSSEEIVDHQPVVVKDGPVNCERYLSWASGFLVVYSIDDRHSFRGCQREVRREADRSPMFPPLCVGEDRHLVGLSSAAPFTAPCYKELPAPATAKLVTVKSSRAQSKRRAPTLTLLKGFKIF